MTFDYDSVAFFSELEIVINSKSLENKNEKFPFSALFTPGLNPTHNTNPSLDPKLRHVLRGNVEHRPEAAMTEEQGSSSVVHLVVSLIKNDIDTV